MMAMCERIIQWLQEHKDELEDIDYADDVDLLGKCLIPRFEFPGIIDIKYGISTESTNQNCFKPCLSFFKHNREND